MSKATITVNGDTHECDVVVGSEGEVGIDIGKLRGTAKVITLDPGYGNTGSCKSAITFIDGEKGILRYRGYPIEQLADKSSFEAVMYLLIWGELPSESELETFRGRVNENATLPDGLIAFYDGLPKGIHPMAALSATTVAMSGFYPPAANADEDIYRLLGAYKALVALQYRRIVGKDVLTPSTDGEYVADFVRMMFDKATPALVEAFNQLFILHADHEQNCSASTVRMVGSSQANLFATISAGVCALWGPLHGGANQKVIEMLEAIKADGGNTDKFLDKAKDKSDPFRLMGFGHRVYKNFDPRAKIIKKAADEVLDELGVDDPTLDIAKGLEKAALEDPYFVERRLYPNVDFYSGIIYRALGIPTEMFTVMFALGRLPGWISQWKEWTDDPKSRIHRPRQIYIGANQRDV